MDAVERTRLADVVHHAGRESTPASGFMSRAAMRWSGTVNSGVSAESLRAIVAELSTNTPVNTGPSKGRAGSPGARAPTS